MNDVAIIRQLKCDLHEQGHRGAHSRIAYEP